MLDILVGIVFISISFLAITYSRYILVVTRITKEDILSDVEEPTNEASPYTDFPRYENNDEVEELVFEDKEFDERIARLKEELIADNFTEEFGVSLDEAADSDSKGSTGVADELHPLVKNIPHSEVEASYGEDGGEEVSV